jgi:hypothetical protein
MQFDFNFMYKNFLMVRRILKSLNKFFYLGTQFDFVYDFLIKI